MPRDPRTGPIQSMTGYGRASRRAAGASVTVELRSTNHRYLEVDCRLPNGLSTLEGAVADQVRRHVRRGRIEVHVALQSERLAQRRVAFDEALLQQYYQALVELKGRFGLKGPITLEQLLAAPHGVQVGESRLPTEQLIGPVQQTLALALAQLVKARQSEGGRLVADLKRQVATIEQAVRGVKRRLPHALKEQQANLRKRIRELLGSGRAPSSGQLEEAVSLIRDVDVNEEMVRLASHLTHIRQVLGQSQAGKALDFIAQELTRETNTLGAKVNDPEASRFVVQIKGCIERVREQAQNLE